MPNIWTFDGRGELLISIMSSLAQEESRSISENVIWGQRKRMADGKPNVPFSRFLGYDRGPDGKYIKNKELKYTGEDLWHDGKIVLLVNGETVSAGDDMTYMMGEYPNVTVVGFTSSNSSCQAVGSVSLDEGNLTFSAVPNLDNDGNVAIDTFTDHKGRVPFDEYIPFSSEAVTAIFDNGTDYQLDYVIKEL